MKTNPKIAIILGTRPEIIKMSPIIRECRRRQLRYFILHTGQHYSYEMDKSFFNELELPLPDYNLDVGSGKHSEQTGKIMIGTEDVLLKERPDIVFVQGDTNTVLSGALAASKLNIKIGHIEAGLRSYDRRMPEEINRIVADHISDFLFAPTEKAKEILLQEGILENRVTVTGNTIVDAIYQNLEISSKKDTLNRLNLNRGKYFLVTAHRQENVDDPIRLLNIFNGLNLVYKYYHLPIICPVHPRTKNRIREFNLKVPKGIYLIPPLGFLEFLHIESNAKLVMTDSGGVQEESCILKVPCVTLRDSTERPETIDVGANMLAGNCPENILVCVKKMSEVEINWRNPFGEGKASSNILFVISGL